VDLKSLAKETEDKVGSDIEFICRKASMLAIRKFIENPRNKDELIIIKKKHFEEAIKIVNEQKKMGGEDGKDY